MVWFGINTFANYVICLAGHSVIYILPPIKNQRVRYRSVHEMSQRSRHYRPIECVCVWLCVTVKQTISKNTAYICIFNCVKCSSLVTGVECHTDFWCTQQSPPIQTNQYRCWDLVWMVLEIVWFDHTIVGDWRCPAECNISCVVFHRHTVFPVPPYKTVILRTRTM